MLLFSIANHKNKSELDWNI